jgi:prepilin-type N-terminal cleavage/methylation domain-containing protein
MFPKKLRNQAGFTLIEMLIVVILLGILAMLIVPQISVSTEDAKLSSLQANLGALRNAVELYYYEHKNTYPGEKTIAGAAATDMGDAAVAFLAQLTQYTDVGGIVSSSNAADDKLGPYLKSSTLPTNPYTETGGVVCNALDDITDRTVEGTTGWKFYPKNGVLMVNDAVHKDM